MNILEKIIDVSTGEEVIVEKTLTAAEIAENDRLRQETANFIAESEAKSAARKAILQKLGLTDEEVNLLLS